jgi:hypothetical protein
MSVTAGQTYTICAGGAATTGSCYSYTPQDGCNSFVCGSNSTCIMSCGGSSTWTAAWTPSCACYYYPQLLIESPLALSCGQWSTCGITTGGKFPQVFRSSAVVAPGRVTTANALKVVAKVASSIGSVTACGISTCYQGWSTVGVGLTGNVECRGVLGVAPSGTGQCANVCCSRFPGMGAIFTSQSCDYSSYGECTGGRGTAGLIRISYK